MNKYKELLKAIITIIFIVSIPTIFAFKKLSEEDKIFQPTECRIYYEHGKYVIKAVSNNIWQGHRHIGGADSEENTIQLAHQIGCRNYRTTTGEWHDLNY